MGNVQVKNVDPDLHEQLRRRAAEADTTISEYLLDLIRRDLRRPTRRGWLARLGSRPHHDIARDDILAAIHDGRAESP
jgi:plasmid stability protein